MPRVLNKMTTIVLSENLAACLGVGERKPFSPRPATGVHAELLAEISQLAAALTKFVELERSGVCDGQGFWIAYDPILNRARKLVALAEQRVSER